MAGASKASVILFYKKTAADTHLQMNVIFSYLLR